MTGPLWRNEPNVGVADRPFWRNEPNSQLIQDFGETNPMPKSRLRSFWRNEPNHPKAAVAHFGETKPIRTASDRCARRRILHPTGREGERSELKRAFCSSLSEL